MSDTVYSSPEAFARDALSGASTILPIMKLEPGLFQAVRAEAFDFISTHVPHRNLTEDRNLFTAAGDWEVFCLYNMTGRVDDMDTTRPYSPDKVFNADGYRALRGLFDAFRGEVNLFNINVGRPSSRMVLHTDEMTVPAGTHPRALSLEGQNLVPRFHIPLVTNGESYANIGGRRYRMADGVCYFYNVCAPHYSGNDGASARVHLLVDVWLTEWSWRVLQGSAEPPPGFVRLGPEDRARVSMPVGA